MFESGNQIKAQSVCTTRIVENTLHKMSDSSMCTICMDEYDVQHRIPLVLKCGHTYCKLCIERAAEARAGRVICFMNCGPDGRAVEDIRRNYSLIDASKIELHTLLSSLNVGRLDRRLWVDEQQLQLTGVELGSGSTGSVVQGLLDSRQVAVKVLTVTDVPNSTRQALQREISVVMLVAGECRHCCQYKGATVKDNKFCLIMRKYDASLMRIIAEVADNGGLLLPKVLRYASQVAAGLAELHAQSVIMLDLKPQNLLLDSTLDELVLTDFGISRVVSQTLGGFVPTNLALAGTLNYMAPEQFCVEDVEEASEASGGGQLLITPAVDVWAWACTVLHMLTGKVPHGGKTISQITMQVGVRKRAPAIPSNLPAQLQQLLQKCLSADASLRPTAQQLISVLNRLQHVADACHPEVIDVLYVNKQLPHSTVKRFSLPWQPQQLLSEFIGQLANHLEMMDAREKFSDIAVRCSVDYSQVLGLQHAGVCLQQLGWLAGCMVVVGELNAEELSLVMNPNALDSGHHIHPLLYHMTYATSESRLFKVDLLLSAGADINCCDNSGQGLLFCALYRSGVDMAHLVLDRVGPKLEPAVLVNGVCLAARKKAWDLVSRITVLLEQKAPYVFPVKPIISVDDREWLLRTELARIKAIGAADIQILPKPLLAIDHGDALEPLWETAVQFDPSCLTRSTGQIDVNGCGGYHGFTVLHIVLSGQGWGQREAPPLLERAAKLVQLAVACPSNLLGVDVQHVLTTPDGQLKICDKDCEMFTRVIGRPYYAAKTFSTFVTPLHRVVRSGGSYLYTDVDADNDDASLAEYYEPFHAATSYEAAAANAQAWFPVAELLVNAGADIDRPDFSGRTPRSTLAAVVGSIDFAAAMSGNADARSKLKDALQRWEQLFGMA